MEEYDELTSGPKEGSLDLSHGQYKEFPIELVQLYRNELVKLSMAFNNLQKISPIVGQLHLLQVLNLSNNELHTIDQAISQCIRLKKLNLSHNKLTNFPIELGIHCNMLEELILHDNQLSVVSELQTPALYTLDLRNNSLREIPASLSCIPTLTKIPCDGNPDLKMIPRDMRDDTELVLWMLNLHHLQNEKEVEFLKEYNKVEDSAKASELEKLELLQKLKRIQEEVTVLKDDIPWNYLALKHRIEKSKTKVSRFVSKSIGTTRDWWHRLQGN